MPQASRLSQSEQVSLKQLAAGTPHSSISSGHLELFKKPTLIERRGSSWILTPLGLQQLQANSKAAGISSADPLAGAQTGPKTERLLKRSRHLWRYGGLFAFIVC
jgi:hypothetical protein